MKHTLLAAPALLFGLTLCADASAALRLTLENKTDWSGFSCANRVYTESYGFSGDVIPTCDDACQCSASSGKFHAEAQKPLGHTVPNSYDYWYQTYAQPYGKATQQTVVMQMMAWSGSNWNPQNWLELIGTSATSSMKACATKFTGGTYSIVGCTGYIFNLSNWYTLALQARINASTGYLYGKYWDGSAWQSMGAGFSGNTYNNSNGGASSQNIQVQAGAYVPHSSKFFATGSGDRVGNSVDQAKVYW